MQTKPRVVFVAMLVDCSDRCTQTELTQEGEKFGDTTSARLEATGTFFVGLSDQLSQLPSWYKSAHWALPQGMFHRGPLHRPTRNINGDSLALQELSRFRAVGRSHKSSFLQQRPEPHDRHGFITKDLYQTKTISKEAILSTRLHVMYSNKRRAKAAWAPRDLLLAISR